MRKPIKMAGETLTHAHTLLLCLTDERGREGWGEASAAPLMTGETLGSIAASAGYLVSRLLGTDIEGPRSIRPLQDAVLYGNASAKSAHETALMDLLAQRAALPLHRLLGAGKASCDTGRLEMLHMLASGDVEDEIEEARNLRRDGFRHWKIKVGAGDPANDVERVRFLCAELRGDVISADANTALTVEAANAIAHAGVDSGLTFLEQPYPVGMLNAMAELHRTSGMSLCADESIQGTDDIAAYHAAGAAQGVSLKLIKMGGTQSLLEAGKLCLSLGLRVNLACKVAETSISAAATAHAGLALGDVAWGFSMSNRYLLADVCLEPLTPEHGLVHMGQFEHSGLGFSADLARLREFASKSVPMGELRGA